MSKTFVDFDNDVKVFCKQMPVGDFDTRTLNFQSCLKSVIGGKFEINKIKKIDTVTDNNKSNYLIKFEHIEEQPWPKNEAEPMKVIGAAMAHIHNFAFKNHAMIFLDEKEEAYDQMGKWLEFREEYPDQFAQRIKIFKKIERLNPLQPKIALHRDFKPHNILYDGKKYYLIDFDFAARDFVSLEVMSFISDILDFGIIPIKAFFKAYFEKININSLYPKSFVDDYLNYLCTNTFPYYMSDKIEPKAFQNLVKARDKSLADLYRNRENIQKIIKDAHEGI